MKKLIFLFICILSYCCKESSTNTVITPIDQNDSFFRYTVVKINNKKIEGDFKASRTFDYPKELKFKYIDMKIIGTVIFEKAGELPIDDIYSSITGCLVNTEGKLGAANMIDFTFFTFTMDSLNGRYCPVGQLTDFACHSFKSIKNK